MTREPVPHEHEPEGSDSESEDPASARLRALLRGAGPAPTPEPTPDLLSGVQRKLRQRSRGKFYGDEWSTREDEPRYAYLLTSLAMLLALGVLYGILAYTSGEPVPVEVTPQPVNIVAPAPR